MSHSEIGKKNISNELDEILKSIPSNDSIESWIIVIGTGEGAYGSVGGSSSDMVASMAAMFDKSPEMRKIIEMSFIAGGLHGSAPSSN